MKMMFLQISSMAKSFLPFSMENADPNLHPFMSFSFQNPTSKPTFSVSSDSCLILSSPVQSSRDLKSLHCSAVSRKSNSTSDPEPSSNSKAKPKKRNCRPKTEVPQKDDENQVFPETIPRKLRRGRRSETVAVEDFIRGSLEKTFTSIRQQNSEILENKGNIMKDRADEEIDTDNHEDEDEDDGGGRGKKMVVEEESLDWPLDADVGWGIRASEYFEKHPIKNVVGEDGVEIDWEGEIDDNWVKEINCLEWESFAFHPSPLIVFVFERYNR